MSVHRFWDLKHTVVSVPASPLCRRQGYLTVGSSNRIILIDFPLTDGNYIIIGNVADINPGSILDSDNLKIFSEYVDHGNCLGLSEKDCPCLGYRLVRQRGRLLRPVGTLWRTMDWII